MRLTSFRVAKSTTANPLKPESWAKIHLVLPSGFVANAMGRMPWSITSDQTGSSVFWSITVIVFDAMEPLTTHFPSGVTYVLWTAPFTGIVLTRSMEVVSMTSTEPGALAMDTYTRLPSLLIEMLLGWPLRGMLLVTL